MTRDRGVDWDRLADHLGGALAASPEETDMARLVATDPGWARAATELSAAFEAVAADLRSLPEPVLPDEIAARLDATLRAAGRPGAAPGQRGPGSMAPAPGTAGPAPGAPGPAGGRTAGEDRRPPGHPRSRSRRRRVVRLGGGFAVAAGVVAFAAIGFAVWSPSQPLVVGGGDDQGEGREFSPEAEQPVLGETGGPVIVATGTDYQQPAVAASEPDLPVGGLGGTPELGTSGDRDPVAQPPDAMAGEERVPDLVPPRLASMWVDPAARELCLELVRQALGPPPVTLETVDFARFESEDALVIWATLADQTRIVWVSGPACGTPGAGPDERFRDQVG